MKKINQILQENYSIDEINEIEAEIEKIVSEYLTWKHNVSDDRRLFRKP